LGVVLQDLAGVVLVLNGKEEEISGKRNACIFKAGMVYLFV
jgi:hypothetical protein